MSNFILNWIQKKIKKIGLFLISDYFIHGFEKYPILFINDFFYEKPKAIFSFYKMTIKLIIFNLIPWKHKFVKKIIQFFYNPYVYNLYLSLKSPFSFLCWLFKIFFRVWITFLTFSWKIFEFIVMVFIKSYRNDPKYNEYAYWLGWQTFVFIWALFLPLLIYFDGWNAVELIKDYYKL